MVSGRQQKDLALESESIENRGIYGASRQAHNVRQERRPEVEEAETRTSMIRKVNSGGAGRGSHRMKRTRTKVGGCGVGHGAQKGMATKFSGSMYLLNLEKVSNDLTAIRCY
jgi:hypothetical protein